MDLGTFSVSLSVKDLATTRAFYEKLGFSVYAGEAEHGFLIGLSMDGPADIHDVQRVDKGGAGTHAKVMRAARLLADAGADGLAFNALCLAGCANDREEVGLGLAGVVAEDQGALSPVFVPDMPRDAPSQRAH